MLRSNLIPGVMPTNAGIFREMLLGSTTAKVLNDADCPVLTSRHAEMIVPGPSEHREWLCAISLSGNSERVLRYASGVATQAHGKLSIIHAVQDGDPGLPPRLDIKEQVNLAARRAGVSLILSGLLVQKRLSA